MNKERKSYTVSKKLKIIKYFFFALLVLLVLRIAFWQFVKGSELKEEMYSQLITSRVVSPNRGTIYDSTGKALAVSARSRYC